MNRTIRRPGRLAVPGVVMVCAAAWSPAQPTAAPTTVPATAPAPTLVARVLEVRGDAEHAAQDSGPWEPCRVDDAYPAQTLLRTGIRSSLKLQLGDSEPYTAVVIDAASKTVLSELAETPELKRVRIGLGYGRLRAGVAEGGRQSSFTVDSPVATLSKRGTWNFGMFYERGTDRFQVFLLDRGLVEALDEVTRERRTLRPQQLVTEAMRRWADQAGILRNVPISDVLGQSDVELAFNTLQNDGLGVLDPGGGRNVLIDLSNSSARQEFANLLQSRGVRLSPIDGGGGQGSVLRPEGLFGTGRGDELIPVMIDSGSDLVTKGYARPGRYSFRRAALENWLRDNARR